MQVLDLAPRHVGLLVRVTKDTRKREPFLLMEGRLEAVKPDYILDLANGGSKLTKVILEISGQRVWFHGEEDVELL